ncbi:bifunctional P-450:NADPH-P450 reductase [Plectosphaerella cucumerina]|uniref:Bifunctional cytochrome P450/NADPH--P450 reductase n=1 Tax=Plectosphaerella cucumerina TaxID=40658 RepID=A0A8K0TLX4_9PEZI|nr:bifunctional P-450:NADPH-P450 reductase [Plectosphaerella cucumerina]
MADSEEVPIPQPAGLPIIGNVGSLDKEYPLGSMVQLAEQFGHIYRMSFPGRSVVFVSTQALIHETCDEKRFRKSINATLNNIRNGVHDGLFTAREGEEAWGIAHRVLMPAFGPLSIQGMFPEMHDIATQLALKWARYGPQQEIHVTDDFTRLALDTLALCSMGFRFNSYYSPTLHPFIESMGNFLVQSGRMSNRLPLPSLFYRSQDQKYDEDIKVLRDTAKEVLEARKAGKSDRRDLLAAMLEGADPKTGKHMSDDSIMDNLITFLIAGHETTSGLLSFAMYQLMKHPEAYRKAQQEVDSVVGKGQIKVQHLSKLPYMNGVLRETLRLNSTIPAFSVEAREDTLLAGKYRVAAGETIINLLASSHLDPAVYGDDAHEFKPERMLDAEFERRGKEFPDCWKPFGNGMRACIGRPFAWQEALLVMTMLLQNFNFVLDPNYVYGVNQTLTIKPKDLYMRAVLREGLTPTTLERRLAGLAVDESESKAAKASAGTDGKATGTPLTILYGSNSGTCESLAQRIASDAPSHGFYAAKVDCLDSANGSLPTDGPVAIVTASYEGHPPDNAGHFVSWIEGLAKEGQDSPLKDVSYAVYGCGNRDWVQTFHRIPKLVDESLEKAGASRVAPMGLTDVSTGEVFTDFETWEDETLWPSLKKKYGSAGASSESTQAIKGVGVTVSTPRTSTLRQDVQSAVVVDTKILTRGGDETQGVKKHIEIKLPEGTTYKSGDYLAILPINPSESVHRVLRRFGIARDAHLKIEADGPTSLPVAESITAYDVLSSYVELSQPTTKRSLLTLVDYSDDTTKAELNRLAGDAFTEEIVSKRTSVLDILERYPAINLPIGIFFGLLPPMRVRQYSISSSPLANPNQATLSFSILGGQPSLSGTGQVFKGVASNFMNSLSAGDAIQIAIRPPAGAHFRLPPDAARTPIICIAAGTGIAPFRAFIQERASMIAAGRKDLAPALLFFGCRSPDHDDLYREDFDEWQRIGAVDVRRSFSRAPEQSNGCKHVQDRMWADREDLVGLWRKDAKVYVCGSRGVANSARDMALNIRKEMLKLKGETADDKAMEQWLESLRNTRYVMDVFD